VATTTELGVKFTAAVIVTVVEGARLHCLSLQLLLQWLRQQLQQL